VATAPNEPDAASEDVREQLAELMTLDDDPVFLKLQGYDLSAIAAQNSMAQGEQRECGGFGGLK